MAKGLKDLKPEEKDEILGFLGFEDFDNFKDAFGQKFFTKETALANDDIRKTIVGSRMTDITSSLLKLAKVVNPELSLRELSKKHVEENIEDLIPMFTGKFSELETKAKDGNDKKLNDLETALAEKDKSILAYKGLAEKTANELETVKQSSANEIKSYKIKHQYEGIKSKLPWIDEPTDVQRIGFDTKIGSSYKFELDEKDQLQIYSPDGKPIPSKVNAGKMATPEEILEAELDANKLKKNNNGKLTPVFGKQAIQTPEGQRKLPQGYYDTLKKVGK